MSNEAIGLRLWLIREALDLGDQTAFAKRLKVERSRYCNWENGKSRIPVQCAVKFLTLTGTNLDYIYRGEVSGLPVKLLNLIEKHEEKLAG